MAGMYSRLAATGIRKNGRSYVPFILTAALMIAIFYIISFLSGNSMLRQMVGGSGMSMILQFGMVVMGLFSAIFLFYTNSFLIKRRKKEFGLYNILGLGKRQIAKILIRETIFVYLIAEVLGLGVGVLFSKLAEMLAMKMLRGNVNFEFYIDPISIIIALILFAAIFVLILINSLRQLFFSRPIELLHSESTGEKPPRTNIPGAVIGFLLLGFAYFMAIRIKDPGMAMGLFFIAVILVIIATYLLFIAGSVVLCRALQKNKRYYYKTNHFVSVSQMTFRMRKNGAGLASICILSTMVLVTLSSTVSLYAGIPDNIETRYPHDITVTMYDDETLQTDRLISVVNECVEIWGYTPQNASVKRSMYLSHYVVTDIMGLDLSIPGEDFQLSTDFTVIPLDEADENIRALNLSLGDNEVAIFEAGDKRITAKPTIKFGELELSYRTIDVTPASVEQKIFRTHEDFALIYVRDLETMGKMYKAQYDIIKPINDQREREAREEAERLGEHGYGYESIVMADFKVEYGFDISEDINEVNEVYEGLDNPYGVWYDTIESSYNNMHLGSGSWRIDTKATFVDEYYGLYGGLLFLGILLGGVFALAAALIMYYKQISEGFEDAARFEILRKVGMTNREIKSAINSQVLKVFFLPLVAAGVHMLFAFSMIAKMLNMFDFYNVGLFAMVTLIGFVIFALLYVLFYKITSKSYQHIVG
ncbi:MAG: ABC transporter permease [Oscillospiraceae bacterium]|nr:ABC transporter permease [Oscillospiraceae bacterium]